MKRHINTIENYILMPASSTQMSEAESPNVASFLKSLNNKVDIQSTLNLNVRSMESVPTTEIELKVLDSIKDNGAKLVSLNTEQLADFRFSYPGLRMIHERFYRPALFIHEMIKTKVAHTEVDSAISVLITDNSNTPIKDIQVIAFTDFQSRTGAQGNTNNQGIVKLRLGANDIQRLYVYPKHSYWGYYRKNVRLTDGFKIKLQSIELRDKDSLRHFYDTSTLPVLTRKVRVGIIDTGVGPHKNLPVKGGKNFVVGEDESEYTDNGQGHGTHVAGIIAASGELSGVAAGVEIMSYRVFSKGDSASNFAIMKAMDQAIKDECDLINLSLGEASEDEALIVYIKEAYKNGILCFAANGNDGRKQISFPASYSLSIAISAMGRIDTFPADSTQSSTLMAPFGVDQNNYLADFSNIGMETDLIAPGVGIVSTYPNDLYAVMDGTSMSCPAATGVAARLLSNEQHLLELPRDQVRADEMTKFLSKNIRSMGFGPNFEGKGMLVI